MKIERLEVLNKIFLNLLTLIYYIFLKWGVVKNLGFLKGSAPESETGDEPPKLSGELT